MKDSPHGYAGQLRDAIGVRQIHLEGGGLAAGVGNLCAERVAAVEVAERQPAPLVGEHARGGVALPEG